ncbi:MAG: hypothetical protein M3R08_04710, partial [Bacteroidota bacterium]|nr:hypothetical protein [Bacteroidota bacterium]
MIFKILFLTISMMMVGVTYAQPDCTPIANLELLDTWQTVSGSYDDGGWMIYEVTMDLGVYYTFKTGCGNGASADHNTIIEWMTPICTVINAADDGCENGASDLNFESFFGDGTVLWIRVRGAQGQGGNFTMAYRSVDGQPGTCNECPAYDQDLSATNVWQTVSAGYS